MKQKKGFPLPLGATVSGRELNFSVAVPEGKTCELLIYKKGAETPEAIFPMDEKDAIGEVRCLTVEFPRRERIDYLYRIDGAYYVDPYATRISGKEAWGEPKDVAKGEIRACAGKENYDWEGDSQLHLPAEDVIAYSLHVRGFTKHPSSKVRKKGTFQGVIQKIPYLVELGINQIHCMPVYEFEECDKKKLNYWGYGPGYYFAPKASYAASGNPVKELKDMVKACHKAGIEVVLEMPFHATAPQQMMEECLRYYMMEYHVDGFILNDALAPMEAIRKDPILKKTKILVHQLGFQNTMRRFLKGDEGVVEEVIYWLKNKDNCTYNYITNQNGFTMNDLVSYDSKHNEANGEENQDGPDQNYSWNCGVEGPSRKRGIIKLREDQYRNAIMLNLFGQGTPCILSGDEFCNTQDGNNNVYCQDNAIGWVQWNKLPKNQEIYRFYKDMISLRKQYPVFRQKKLLKGVDLTKSGVPDISYHGEYAWHMPTEYSSRILGVCYNGDVVKDDDCYVIYNMHWIEHCFALPNLMKKKKWRIIATSRDGILDEPEVLKNQHDILVPERTIMILMRCEDEKKDEA